MNSDRKYIITFGPQLINHEWCSIAVIRALNDQAIFSLVGGKPNESFLPHRSYEFTHMELIALKDTIEKVLKGNSANDHKTIL